MAKSSKTLRRDHATTRFRSDAFEATAKAMRAQRNGWKPYRGLFCAESPLDPRSSIEVRVVPGACAMTIFVEADTVRAASRALQPSGYARSGRAFHRALVGAREIKDDLAHLANAAPAWADLARRPPRPVDEAYVMSAKIERRGPFWAAYGTVAASAMVWSRRFIGFERRGTPAFARGRGARYAAWRALTYLTAEQSGTETSIVAGAHVFVVEGAPASPAETGAVRKLVRERLETAGYTGARTNSPTFLMFEKTLPRAVGVGEAVRRLDDAVFDA